MQRTHSNNRIWLWLIPILLIMTWLGSRSITVDILFVDEYWSIRNSGGDPFGTLGLMGIWERTATVDPGGMGVLYHWLLNGWGRLIGWSIFSIRVFSLMAGVLAVAMIYRLGKSLFNKQVGLYSASVLASSAFFIYFLHEARAYTLLTFLTSLTIYIYHHILHRDKVSVGWYIGLSLSLAALAYTHYIALAMGVVLGVYHLSQFRNTRRWWMIFGAMAIGGILFLPWLTVTLNVVRLGAGDTNRQGDSMTTLQILQNLLSTFSNLNLGLLAFMVILALREFTKNALLIWIWLIVGVVMTIIINAAIPFMVHLRYLMIVFPALAVIVALGIFQIRRMGVPVILVLLVWIGAGVYQTFNIAFVDNLFGQIYRAPADGFNRAYDILQERSQDGDMALYHIIPPEFEPFNLFVLGYYFNPFDVEDIPLRYDQFERMNNMDMSNENTYLQAVWDSLDDAPAVWTMRIPELETTYRTTIVDFALETAYSHCETIFTQEDMVMDFYAKEPQEDASTRFAHDDSTSMAVYDLQRGYQTDEALHITLGFIADEVPVGMYSVGLHLLGSDGVLVSQVDNALPDDRPFSCAGYTIPLSEISDGNYTTNIIIYNWQTGERLLADGLDIVVLQDVTIQDD